MIKVGIPRALLYYQYYPMWKTFFEELGAEVVVSSPTTQNMLSSGSSRVVADTCLPVKVFLGHVISLVGKCDYIFVPAIRSVKKKVYNCSKFLGLPDMTAAVIPESPPILDIDIDVNEGRRTLYEAIYSLGRHFTWNPMKIRQASIAAWQAYLSYKQLMSGQRLALPDALEAMMGLTNAKPEIQPDSRIAGRGIIAIIGHPYLVYDEHVNHRLVHRLEQAGYEVVTPEMLTDEELEAATIKLAGETYWTYDEEVVGAGGYYLDGGADGIIGIMTFGCGTDSLMMEMVRRQAMRLKTTPLMILTLEEHTAEAGVVTRLEAFVDMLQRKKRKETEVCV